MTYSELKSFLDNKMRMSHIYQPVMILKLLENGTAYRQEIAETILSYDESQKDYYEEITDRMVGQVLRKHKIVKKEKKQYSLNGFNHLNIDEINHLKEICISKINTFLTERKNVWEHRTKSSGYISGSIRSQVFIRSNTRCESCGITNDKKALEVDHIIPRNKGGSDDLSNLQALCYSCNSMKSDKDDTDFAKMRESYNDRHNQCIFCDDKKIVKENELAYCVADKFPVTKGHTLIIPKRHVETYFELYQPELNSINQLITDMKQELDKKDKTITGYNIGINNGESAGQTIFHAHVHLIPRRNNDTNNPMGGVRGVIPNKKLY